MVIVMFHTGVPRTLCTDYRTDKLTIGMKAITYKTEVRERKIIK